jgi:hypothetical protein
MRAIVLVILSSCLFAESQLALMIGEKKLDGDDWGTLDKQFAYGLQGIFGFKDSPWAIYAALIGSDADDSGEVLGTPFTVDAHVTEIQVGPAAYGRLFGADKPFLGHIAAGLDYARVSVDYSFPNDDVSLEDGGFGFFLSGGLYALLGKHLVIGPCISWSSVDVSDDINGVQIDGNAGGFIYAAVLGVSW